MEEHKGEIDGFYGAFFGGSTNFTAEEDVQPKSSDVDIHIVIDGEIPTSLRQRKCSHKGLILELAFDKLKDAMTPDKMLSSCFHAHNFSVPCVISDPSGHLGKIQEAVAKNYEKAEWVRKRCEDARNIAKYWLNRCSEEDLSFIDCHFSFLFGSVWIADPPIITDLGIPTVRRWFLPLREVLGKHDRLHLYGKILELNGIAQLKRMQVVAIYKDMVNAFDRAVEVIQTPVSYEFNICRAARPYAIGGSQQMIEDGDYRGAVPFIMWIYYTSINVIQNDASEEEKTKYLRSYQNALNTLGFTSKEVIIERAKKMKEELLPEIMEVAEYIIEHNPDVIK